MQKFLNKWLRKLHRWLVLPFITLLLTVIFARGTSLGDSTQRIQSVLMIIMAITGAYLYLLPYWTKQTADFFEYRQCLSAVCSQWFAVRIQFYSKDLRRTT